MAGELVRWLSTTPAEREHDQTLERVHRNEDVAMARVGAVARVSQTAVLGALSVSMTKREAALLVPEGAAKFDLIATSAAVSMAGEIQRLAGKR